MQEVGFVTYDHEFLELSWYWLNDPEIKLLTNTPSFTRDQQKKWFDSLTSRADYKVWGLKINNIAAGVVGLKNINNKEGEYFGYIGVKELWGKGYSKHMLDFVASQARMLGLKGIYLKVSRHNLRAISAYEKYGYTPLSFTENECMMHILL